MHFKFIFLLSFNLCFSLSCLQAQSIRGLSVVNDNIVWASGSKGSVLRTQNAGITWDTLTPNGYRKKDFRDIHAWNSTHAIIMSSGDSGVLLETRDGGVTWKLIYHDYRKGSFFDAIDVQKNKIVLVGDGIDGQNPYIILIDNKRKTYIFKSMLFTDISKSKYWSTLAKNRNDTFTFFAASGSNVQWLGKNRFGIIPVSRDSTYYLSGKFSKRPSKMTHNSANGHSIQLLFEELSNIPFKSQKAGGAYSFISIGEKTLISTGGSFYFPDSGNCAAFYSTDAGKHWQKSNHSVSGYRSGLAYHNNTKMSIATGPNGTDYSYTNGENWNSTSLGGFNVCAFSKKYLWLAGDLKKGILKVHVNDIQPR